MGGDPSLRSWLLRCHCVCTSCSGKLHKETKRNNAKSAPVNDHQPNMCDIAESWEENCSLCVKRTLFHHISWDVGNSYSENPQPKVSFLRHSRLFNNTNGSASFGHGDTDSFRLVFSSCGSQKGSETIKRVRSLLFANTSF